ncbi:10140_t:CDS:10 [Diversispora eburnea]|uniref:10140_t:CDS:1 n=1 Tax=Diversispora eburnea TaxID=1213867 RepID=A0A9N8V6F3_9GLOM|nr:10140_t:CDS:10 [Diversispora eburnea]
MLTLTNYSRGKLTFDLKRAAFRKNHINIERELNDEKLLSLERIIKHCTRYDSKAKHVYFGSPFSKKVIWALAIKKVPWKSVTVSPIVPRPLLKQLAHGYRRIPVLQIGSDIFVDTSMILEELERRKGSDKSDIGIAKSMIFWTDRYLFNATLRSSFASIDPKTPKIFLSKEFIDDRSSLIGYRIDPEKLLSTRSQTLDELRSCLELTESQLNDDREWFLDTVTPGMADINIGVQLFFLNVTKSAQEFTSLEKYPKTYKWFQRFRNYVDKIQLFPINITGEEALNIAKQYKPVTARIAQLEDKKDLFRKVGDRVKVEPEDYGKIPTIGIIVSLGNSHVAIVPDDVVKTGIEVAIWFPRMETLKEILNFPSDPIDILTNKIEEESSSSVCFLVLTFDGSIWCIQSPIQRKKRINDEEKDQKGDNDDCDDKTLQNSTFNSSNLLLLSNNLPPFETSIFSSPSIINVTNDEKIFQKANNNKNYNSLSKLSISNTIISKELASITFGYSNGLIYYHPLIMNNNNEPIQAIYALSLKREVDESKVIRNVIINNNEKPCNAFLIVGTKFTVAIMTNGGGNNSSGDDGDGKLDDDEKSDENSIAYKEYYVSEPIHSSLLIKNRLILAVETGKILIMNFDNIMFSQGKLVTLYTIPVYFPRGIIRLCHYNVEDNKSCEGILYALSLEGKLIRAKEMQSEVKNKLNRIAEFSTKQEELEKINEDDINQSPLKVECTPFILPISLTGSVVVNRAHIKIRLSSLLGINWSQYWSLIVRMMNLNSPGLLQKHTSIRNLNDSFPVMSYSIPLIDMKADMNIIWERDLEINLRFLHFPISINLGLCFSPPAPTYKSTTNNNYYEHGNFFATKTDLRKAIETIICAHGSDEKPISDLISSLNSDYAVFMTPLSLEPIIFNFKRLNENDVNKSIPSNTIPVELRIKCNSEETLLLVEEAVLRRLEDFSVKDENMMDIDEPVNWEDLRNISEQLESEVKELIQMVRNDMNNMWIDGIIEL